MSAIVDAKIGRIPCAAPQISSMTVEQFDAWVSEDSRAEFADGKVFLMSPVSGAHADIQAWLIMVISNYVRRKSLGKARGPDFQMRLPGKRFEPDVLFAATANAARWHKAYFDGPGDMVIEVVSPESAARDWHDKFAAYQTAGIPEYWIIDPLGERSECYQLRNGAYQAASAKDDRIYSSVIDGLYLRPDWFWSAVLPDPLIILQELGVLKGA
jgi:Uma2 family endonuclease